VNAIEGQKLSAARTYPKSLTLAEEIDPDREGVGKSRGRSRHLSTIGGERLTKQVEVQDQARVHVRAHAGGMLHREPSEWSSTIEEVLIR
jgi:hypothetical protein